MKKHLWAGIAIFSLFISACGTQKPTETPLSGEDVQLTSEAIAFTIVAETQAAIPTNTATELPTATLVPTNTSTPIPTVDTLLITTSPTAQIVSEATADPCNQPLLSWEGDSADLDIYYEYSPQGKDDYVVVSLWVMTDLGQCGFLADLTTGPIGQYSALAFIDGEKNFKVTGGFRISQGSWKLIIRNNGIVAQGGCYPNC